MRARVALLVTPFLSGEPAEGSGWLLAVLAGVGYVIAKAL
jgi:hypothetical protein